MGDIAYGAAEVASASRAGLGGVFYWEVLGLDAPGLPAELTRLRYPESQEAFGARVVPGLSPHSPYTSGPALLRAVHDTAERFGAPVAIHVAESAAESELMHLRYRSARAAGIAYRRRIRRPRGRDRGLSEQSGRARRNDRRAPVPS